MMEKTISDLKDIIISSIIIGNIIGSHNCMVGLYFTKDFFILKNECQKIRAK
jgi:hypothetical protein